MTDKEILSSPESFHQHLAELQGEAPAEAEAPIIEEEQTVEEETPPAPEPEPQQESDDDSDVIEAVNGQVPVSVLKRQVAKLRAEREEKIRYKTENDNIKRALEIYAQQESGEPQKEEVNTGFDPLDTEADRFYKAKIAELESKYAKLEAATNKTAVDVSSSAFKVEVTQQYSAAVKEKPDLDAAYNHIAQAEYKKNLRVLGDEAKARDATNSIMNAMAVSFYQGGKNVPKEFYDIALEYGYTPKGGKPTNGVNIDAIEKNIKKTSGVGSIPGASAAPTSSNPASYFTPQGVKNLQNRPGGSIDPAKFQAILDGITKNAKR